MKERDRQMPLVNLFEKCSGFDYLQEIYRISDQVLARIIRQCIIPKGIDYIVPSNSVSIFLKETGIHPDTFQLNEVKLHCKHVTTCYDNGKSILRNGLLPLNNLLEGDSDLSIFLAENGIHISPSNRYIYYYDQKWEIPLTHSDEFLNLSSKLYHDNGEIEAFISGSEEDILSYSNIRHYPEILNTIKDTIYKLVYKDIDLGRKWHEKNPQCFIAEFDVDINAMSYINSLLSYEDAPGVYQELEEFVEYGETPLFWKNEWLIRNCLDNACPGTYDNKKTVGIKNDVHIIGSMINLRQVK